MITKRYNLIASNIIFLITAIFLLIGCGGSKKNQDPSDSASSAYENSSWSTAKIAELDANIANELAKAFFEAESDFVFGKKVEFLIKNKLQKTTHPISYVNKGQLNGSATIAGSSYFNDSSISFEPIFPNVSTKTGSIEFSNYSNTNTFKINGTASLISNLVGVDTNTGIYNEVLSGGISVFYKDFAYNINITLAVKGKETSSEDLLTIRNTYDVVYTISDTKGNIFSGSLETTKTKTISESIILHAEALEYYKNSLWPTATISDVDEFNADELTTAFINGHANNGYLFSDIIKGLIKADLEESSKIISSIEVGQLSGSAALTGNIFKGEEIGFGPNYPRVFKKIENIICTNYSDNSQLKVNGKLNINTRSVAISPDNRTESKTFTGVASFLYKDVAYNLVFKWVVTSDIFNSNSTPEAENTYNIEYTYTDANDNSTSGVLSILF